MGIGTGKTATADQANEVNGYIRSVIAQLYGQALQMLLWCSTAVL